MTKRMRLILFLLAIICLFIPDLHSQEKRLEVAVYECIRNAYPDQGKALDSLVDQYENELVAQGFLEDRSAESYYNLFQRLASGSRIERDLGLEFVFRMERLPAIDSTASLKCQENLIDYDPGPEGGVKLALFELTLYGPQASEKTRSQLAQVVLDLLETGDFNLPLYRLQTYWILDLQEPVELPEVSINSRPNFPAEGSSTLRLYYTQDGQILIDNVQIDPAWIKKRIERHFRDYRSETVFVVTVDPDLRFREYLRVKDQLLSVINTVRNEYAVATFGKSIANLDEKERQQIDAAFPIQVVFPN